MSVTTEKLAYKHDEAADALGISPRTLQRWRTDGIVKPIKVRGTLLYPKEQLDRVLAGKETNGNPK